MDSKKLGEDFISEARSYLTSDFLPKIRECLDALGENDIWWRADETNNSVGNLLLHLAGNVRQWIVSGVGGKPDVRERPKEFAERKPLDKEELWQGLERAVKDADQVLKDLPPHTLLEQKVIQGFDRSVLQAVFHVVEHFSYHTGQIIFITKLRKGVDLKFYNL